MIQKLRKIMQPHVFRPFIYMTSTRFLLGLAAVLLYARFSDPSAGTAPKMFGFTLACVVFALLAWIAYLRLDNMKLPKLFNKRVNIKKKPVRTYGDMIDYIDEEPVSFDDLENDEKDVCCFLADVICAVAFAILSFL